MHLIMFPSSTEVSTTLILEIPNSAICSRKTSRNGKSSPASERRSHVGERSRARSERSGLDSHLLQHPDEKIRQQRVVPAIVGEMAAMPVAQIGLEDELLIKRLLLTAP